MKRILVLAIVLLNLLSLTEVSAQNYISETEIGALLSKILADAMNSDADIYSVVFDESYGISDFSDYGDFSQEITYYSSIEDYQSSGIGDSGTSAYKTVYIDKDGLTTILEYYVPGQDAILLPEIQCNSNPRKYCSLCGKWILVEEWDGHHNSSVNIPTVGDDGISNGKEYGDDTPIGALPSSGRITVNDFLSLMMRGVHIANMNIPKEFHEQTLKYECVVRGIANVAQIMGRDYSVAYEVMSGIAKKEGYTLSSDGIPDERVHKLFGEYVTLSKNQCSETFIDSQVDAHKNVLVSIWTEDGPHMVTVLGYDEHSYYCAAGFKDVDVINKKLIDTSRSAFVVEKINGHYK